MPQLSRSAAAYQRAQRVMPGGNTRSSTFESPHPVYLDRGEGAYVFDVDGARYLDLQNNFTALIHGHGHPGVTAALAAQIEKGLSFSNPTVAEIELAEILCGRTPYFDHVRFTNTGSEAVMMAIKAARSLTGRRIIAKCEGAYHGNYDFVEMSVAHPPETWDGRIHHGRPSHAGVAACASAEVVIIPFNDVEATLQVLDQVKDQLAAVLVDPLPSRIGLTPISRAYLVALRQFADDNGCLLISDEVLSFRLGYAGAMGGGEVFPDLCAFGKIIGGGLPIGALAGSADAMRVFDPSQGTPLVGHAGTFTANPMTMTAGAAAMRAMTPEAFERLNALGADARARLQSTLADAGVTGAVTGAGSLFRLFLGRSHIETYSEAIGTKADQAALARIVARMRDHGVLLSSIGLGALSTPMSSDSIDLLVDAFRDALRDMIE